MAALVVVLLHDRFNLARRCIESINDRTSGDARIVYALDAVREDVDLGIRYEESISSKANVGAGCMMNSVMREFWGDEDVIRVDSDTVIETENWTEILSGQMRRRDLAMASPVWPEGMRVRNVLCSGVLAIR